MSAKNWPSDGRWPLLIDDMDIVYKNETFDALEYYLELANGSEATEQSIARKADQLQDYVARNFMKVKITQTFVLNIFLF